MIVLPATQASAAPSTTLVINEVYGGGGNSGATYTHDFVEVTNIGSTTVDVSGYSVQYASATGTTYQTTILAGEIPPGETYLVQEAQGSGGTTPLPAPDATGTIAMSGTAGKVALVSSLTALTCGTDCDAAAGVVDFVGYGTTANDFEGAGPAPQLSNTTSATRSSAGTDTDNNAADFTAGGPSPVNCGEECVPTTEPPEIGECGDPATFVHQIQGSGAAFDPAFGGSQIIEGVVTAVMLGGMFVQEEAVDHDADPLTSEGIFVALGSATAPDVGSVARVAGTVQENFDRTELIDVTVLPCEGDVDPVESAAVSFPLNDPDDLERFEGMQVQLVDELVISEYFNYARFGEVVVAAPPNGWNRLYNPTAVVEPGAPAIALAAEYDKRIITIDDASNVQNPSSIPHPGNGDPFSLTNRFRGGDTITGITGIMDYSFSLYRLQPIEYGDFAVENPRPAAAPNVGGEVTVASFNVLNYFLTLDQGGSTEDCGPVGNEQECRGADADQPNELPRQRAKIVAALAELDADVVGLMEMENTPGVEPAADLAAGLNDVLGAGTYDYVDTGVVGTDAIRVGFLYKPGVVSLAGDFDVLDSSDDPRFIDTSSRPMITQTFDETASGERFTVSVNHLKSKGSACTGDPDTGDGSGNCNITRTQAAEAIVDHLAADPTGSGDPDHLIIGDLNSYDHEDPIDSLVTGGYTDLVKREGGELAYGYVFDGQSGYLDHALANASMEPQVTGAAEWHINADEANILDYDTSFKPDPVDAIYAPDQFRSSDHDAVLVGLDMTLPPVDLTIQAVPPTITFGDSSLIKGFLREEDGSPVAGREVRLQSRITPGGEWDDTGDTDTTGSNGVYSFEVEPTRNTFYRVVFAGDSTYAGTESVSRKVNVATRVSVFVSDQVVKKGTTVLYTGVVAPNHAGQVVNIQRRNANGTWRTIDTARLNQDSQYVYRYRANDKGTSTWRIVKPADSHHVIGMSRTFTLRVT